MTMPPVTRTGGITEGRSNDLTTRVQSTSAGATSVLLRTQPEPPVCHGDRWRCGAAGLLDRWIAGTSGQCCVDADTDTSVVPITDGGDHR